MSDATHPRPWEEEEWLARVRAFARGLEAGEEHDALFVRAFTHRSLADCAPHGDNERLEFLGDSVLALLVNDYLYRTHSGHTEGQLTRLKTRYVSEPSLAEAAEGLALGELLAMAHSDEVAGGRSRPSTLSDAFEAVLAALYLARGLEAAREFVRESLIERVDPTVLWDHKSRLQELLQEKRRITPVYVTEVDSGPAHERTFRSQVRAGSDVLGEGTGRTKKSAEQVAALDALTRIEKPKKVRKRAVKKPAVPNAVPAAE